MADRIQADMYLYPHFRNYFREVRIVAYSQFLESYKSVTMKSVAAAFNVGVDFLDRELSDFIVAGRLHAKIDKVAGVVETNRCEHSITVAAKRWVFMQRFSDAVVLGEMGNEGPHVF